MNAEKIYTAACEIIRFCVFENAQTAEDKKRSERIYNQIINDPAGWINGGGYGPIINAAEILIEARAAMDTKTTSAAALAALKRIVKGAQNGWAGQFEQAGKWYICDGYRLYSSPEKFPATIPTIEQHTNVTRFIDRLEMWKYRRAPESLTRAALKEFTARPEYKSVKYGKPPFVVASDGQKIGFDPAYLLDAMTIYPNAEIHVSGPYDPAALVENGKVVAIVQPCHLISDREVNAA